MLDIQRREVMKSEKEAGVQCEAVRKSGLLMFLKSDLDCIRRRSWRWTFSLKLKISRKVSVNASSIHRDHDADRRSKCEW